MPVFDVHAHLGAWPFPIQASRIEDIEALMRRCEIRACLVSSTKAIVYDMEEGNADVAAAIAGREGLFGYVVVNPNFLERSCAQLDEYYGRPQFAGAKIHPSYARTPMAADSLRALVAEVARRGRPLLIHCNGGEVAAAARLAAGFPALPIILGHAGFDAWPEAARAAAEQANVYLEFCGTTAHRDKIRGAVDLAGARKVLFGSDLTLLDPGYGLGLIEDSGLDERTTRMILWENARNLFEEWMP
jgi:predicted TIM-barrel fold metal-dependent hydrolase